MNSRQEQLRDKLFAGHDLLREIMSLKSYIEENEKIAAAADNAKIRGIITMQNEELNREYARLIDIRSKIDRCICTINDNDLRSFMIMKYLGHCSNLECGEKLYWSRRTCDRKHVEALNRIIETGADRLLDY